MYKIYIYMDKKYKDLKEREYRCNVCNNKEDRDVNASINIMFEGLKLYMKEVFSIVQKKIQVRKGKNNLLQKQANGSDYRNLGLYLRKIISV